MNRNRPGRAPNSRLRLVAGGLGFTVSLLAIFPAPTTLLWMLAIGVTEWGYLFAPLPLLLLLPGGRASLGGRIAALLGLLTTLLLLSPLLRALPVAASLPARLTAAFGAAAPRSEVGAPPRPAPLHPLDLFRGIASPEVREVQRSYQTVGGETLGIDLFLPRLSQAPAPVVLVIHGGGWRSGDRSELPRLNRYLSARGYLVASIDYRLAPRAPFPAAYDDVKGAIAYLKANAGELGVDPERIVLLGRSAGGELALLVAYTAEAGTVRGVIALYAPADLQYSYAHPGNRWVIDSRGLLEGYLGGPPIRRPTAYDAASPIRFVGPRTPPTLLIHGGRDELVSPAQSERLAARLEAAGRPMLLLSLPWAIHACDAHFNGPCGQISTYAIERFLAAVTK